MNILILAAPFDMQREPRTYKQILCYGGSHNVTAVGKKPSYMESKYIPYTYKKNKKKLLQKMKKFISIVVLRQHEKRRRKFIKENRQLIEEVKKDQYDIIIAHNIESLIFAFEVKADKIVYDSHEYLPRHITSSLRWRLLYQKYYTYLTRQYLPKIDALLVESEMTKCEYKKSFVYNCNTYVLPNAPYFSDLYPSDVSEEKRIQIIHHGVASVARDTESMFKLAKYLDNRFVLNFVFVNSDDDRYLNKLKKKYDKLKNIKYHTPVKMQQIPEFLNQFDIGLFLLSPKSYHYQLTLPNKFFEFIQARLCCAVGPTRQMVDIVKNEQLGVFVNKYDVKSMAKKINALSIEEIKKYKNRAHDLAGKYSFESYSYILEKILK